MSKFVSGDYVTELVEVTDEDEGVKGLHLNVTATAQLGVDRSFVAGWRFELKQRPIAERLLKCIQEYKAFLGYEVYKDTGGKTGAHTLQAEFFHGRHINSSLEKLGF